MTAISDPSGSDNGWNTGIVRVKRINWFVLPKWYLAVTWMRPKLYVYSVISDIISILLFKYKKIPPKKQKLVNQQNQEWIRLKDKNSHKKNDLMP